MKRVIIIVLACIYTVSCFGMTASSFYCCGKLASVSLSLGLQGKVQPDKHKCCKTETLSLKIKDNHVSSNLLLMQPVGPVDVPVKEFRFTTTRPIETNVFQVHSGNSPPGTDVAIYIFNCTYRIWPVPFLCRDILPGKLIAFNHLNYSSRISRNGYAIYLFNL